MGIVLRTEAETVFDMVQNMAVSTVLKAELRMVLEKVSRTAFGMELE